MATYDIGHSLTLSPDGTSSYGLPSLTGPQGRAYGPADKVSDDFPAPISAANLVYDFGYYREDEGRALAVAYLSQWPDGPQLRPVPIWRDEPSPEDLARWLGTKAWTTCPHSVYVSRESGPAPAKGSPENDDLPPL